MIIFRFDGSFDGLLTAVFDSFSRKETPEMLLQPHDALPLFYDVLHEVDTGMEKARRVWKKLSKELQNAVSLTYHRATFFKHGKH